MGRASWFDDKAEHPLIQEEIQKLDAFTGALADGLVTAQELRGQEERLIAAMRDVEDELSDAQHAKVTRVLIEMTAYNVMRLLHELRAEHARAVFGR